MTGKMFELFLKPFFGFILQRKAFEEDRATWLKHQFLNLSPFADSKKTPLLKSKSAFLICESLSFLSVSLKWRAAVALDGLKMLRINRSWQKENISK